MAKRTNSTETKYFHWSAEQVSADELEVLLNTLNYDGYAVHSLFKLGESETAEDADEVDDMILVVSKKALGVGAHARKKLLDCCGEDGYNPEDSEEESDDDEAEG